MRNLKLAFALAASLIVSACPALAQNEFATPTSGKTVVGFQVMCQNGSNQAVPCSSTVPLQIGGTFSATLGGFTPSLSGARGTPITVATSDSSGTLPTGTVVDVSNVGSNPMYCNVNGVAATAADKLIASNSWFEFTIPAGGTTLHCIATGGSTTANLVGGAGLGTGAGGGSSGGGGGGNVNLTGINGTTPGTANPLFVAPGTGQTFPVSGTFWQTTQPVSAASLPLPSGAATAANQATEITSLATIAANTAGSSPAGSATIGAVTGPSAVPLATSANQTTGTQYGNQANWVSGAASQTGTTATTIITAPVSNKLYVKSAQCSRDDAGTTAIRVTFNDGASTPMLLPNNGGGGANNATFDPPLIVASTTAFQFTPSTSISTVRCSAQAYNAP